MRLLLFALLIASPRRGAEWFVAPRGNDAWSGTFAAPNADASDGPFATLVRAGRPAPCFTLDCGEIVDARMRFKGRGEAPKDGLTAVYAAG